jgi:hypothetical protein
MHNDKLVSRHDEHKEDEIDDAILFELDERDAANPSTRGKRKKYRPFVPPEPTKFYPKLWTEWTAEEKKAFHRNCKKRVPGYLGSNLGWSNGKVRTPEHVLWEQDKAERLRDFHGQKFGEEDGSWLVGLIKATPEEREAKFAKYADDDEQRDVRDELYEWQWSLSPEDCIKAIKGTLQPPEHIRSRMRVNVITPEQEAKEAAEKLAKEIAKFRKDAEVAAKGGFEAAIRLTNYDHFAIEAEKLLGREVATREEMDAIHAYADTHHRYSKLHRAGEEERVEFMDFKKQKLYRACMKTREKLENLREGKTTAVIKATYEASGKRKAAVKRKVEALKADPEAKAKRAEYMKAYRARKKASV